MYVEIGHAVETPTPVPVVSETPTPTPTPNMDIQLNVPSSSPFSSETDLPLLDEKIKITDIIVEGTETRQDSTLIAMFIKVGDVVSGSQIKEDLQRILGLGYFLDVTAKREPYQDGFRLIIKVVENPKIIDIKINDITVFKKEKIKELFKDQLNETFNFNDVRDTVEKINNLYQEKGYTLVRVTHKIDPKTQTLNLKINEGIIEDIKVSGNEITKSYVILREVTQKPGDLFNINIMRQDLSRVFNTNFFETVNLKPEPGIKDPDKVIITIEVKEKETGAVNLSLGYNTQQGIVGGFIFSKNNLFGIGQKIDVNAQIGFGILSQVTAYGQLSFLGKVGWYDPWLFPGRTSVGVNLYSDREPQYGASLVTDRKGLSFSIGRPLFGDPITSPWRGVIGFKTEGITVYKIYENQIILSPKDSVTQNKNATDNIFGLSLSLSYDTRDIIMDPHDGWFGMVMAEPFWGDYNSWRFRSSINRYIPVFDWLTLAIGTNFGIIIGSSYPVYEKFFSGGYNVIRGWPEYGTLQGDKLFIGSLELRFPIYKLISGVVFLDIGNFWEPDKVIFSDFIYGFGPGIRVNTPMGSLRFDIGCRDINNLGDWGKAWNIHFSIGQKF